MSYKTYISLAEPSETQSKNVTKGQETQRKQRWWKKVSHQREPILDQMVRIKINICYLIQQIFRYRAAPAEERTHHAFGLAVYSFIRNLIVKLFPCFILMHCVRFWIKRTDLCWSASEYFNMVTFSCIGNTRATHDFPRFLRDEFITLCFLNGSWLPAWLYLSSRNSLWELLRAIE